MMAFDRRFVFSGGAIGPWLIESVTTVSGDPLAAASRLSIEEGQAARVGATWSLAGVTSNLRYTTGDEAGALAARKPALGRAESSRAAFIPIRKTEAWWALPQDERRAIYEDRSRHTTIGLEYLPRIARRLHHCRDLAEPFDFLTWFEFAPQHEPAFDELVARLRESEEWSYVEREVDIRLALA